MDALTTMPVDGGRLCELLHLSQMRLGEEG